LVGPTNGAARSTNRTAAAGSPFGTTVRCLTSHFWTRFGSPHWLGANGPLAQLVRSPCYLGVADQPVASYERCFFAVDLTDGQGVVPDLALLNTVLLAPNISPGSVITVLRFADHQLQVEPPRVSLSSPKPSVDGVAQHRQAVIDFADAYLGRRGLEAIGFNLQFRRRPSVSADPAQLVLGVISQSVIDGIGGDRDPEASVTVHFIPPFADRAQVTIERSKKEDVEAVYFAFNYHYQVASTPDERTVHEVVRLLPDVFADADRIVSDLLAAMMVGEGVAR
jgi:hypothetical protein